MKRKNLTISHAFMMANLHAESDLPWEILWSIKSYTELLVQSSIHGIGLFDGGRLASFLLYQDDGQDVEILYITTAKSYRRQGLATQLMQELLQLPHRHPFRQRIYLDVCAENKSAIIFYEKLRFQASALRKNYYTRNGVSHDAILYYHEGEEHKHI